MSVTRRSLPVLLAASLLAAGCTIEEEPGGGPVGEGTIKRISALDGQQVTVGSKEFDEQLLLGQIAIVALKAAGAKPVDKTNITGSANVRRSLTAGSIDLYWEYTGTAWVTYLKKNKPIPDAERLYDAVKKADAGNDVVWWARSPANNTYALAVNKEAKAKHGTTTLSEYAELARTDPAEAATCIGPEFKSRDDGFPGLQQAYDFELSSEHVELLNDAVIYPTTRKGDTCNFGMVATTDGRIAANELTPLEDDKGFFPIYNPAISIRAEVAKKYPELEAVFEPIARELTTEVLLDLNRKVSVDGEKPVDVATDWLKAQEFIT